MFESIILNNLVFNETYSRKVVPHLKAEWFRNQSEQIVFSQIKDFISKYNVPPTIESLAINISNSPLHEGIYDEVMEVVSKLHNDESNTEWLVNESEKWAQNQAIVNALYQAMDVIEGRNKELDKNAVPMLLSDAIATCFDTSVGHSYFENAEEQWEFTHSLESKVPFSIDLFNRITKNGVPKKTLNIIGAPINAGKSIWLVQQAADWLVLGKNVLVISMEMSEESYRERIDACVLDMTFDQVHALDKYQYLNHVNSLRRKTAGELFVKEYAAGSAHVGHFRHLIQELKIKKGFIPDVIFVDYLTIMASAKLHPSARGNTNTYFTSVAEELRAFAKELDVPVWTAIQLDRGSQGAADAGISNVGLAIGISATADFMFLLLEPDEFRERSQMIGKVIKNRYGSFKGKFLLGKNAEKQQFYDVDATGQSDMIEDGESSADDFMQGTGMKKNDTNGWSF